MSGCRPKIPSIVMAWELSPHRGTFVLCFVLGFSKLSSYDLRNDIGDRNKSKSVGTIGQEQERGSWFPWRRVWIWSQSQDVYDVD